MLLFAPACVRGIGAQTDDLTGDEPPRHAVWLDSLDISTLSQVYGAPQAGRSFDGGLLTLGGVVYEHGIGTHATNDWVIDLNGSATRFVAVVGVDDERKSGGSVQFQVRIDGRIAASTPVLRGGGAPVRLDVDLRGAKMLELRVGDGGDGITNDHADWAGAAIYLDPGAKERPRSGFLPSQSAPRLRIPPPDPAPAIHGPRVLGAAPGHELIFRIPATGQPPLRFYAQGLPESLSLDAATGIVRGAAPPAGVRAVQLTVRGPKGEAHRTLTIVTGRHKLALTPPMGWNSYCAWSRGISQTRMREAADAMVATGLAAHGYQYVNMDDSWEGRRDAAGEPLTNNKFPKMRALCDYVHSLGLKVGIYSSPGPRTCGEFVGSYRHEDQDAAAYARWGMDYLKYDYCSYSEIAARQSGVDALERLKIPYRVMSEALERSGRDIVFSFCQYGMGDVWKWGEEAGGNCWRTTGDITDSWGSIENIIESQNGHEKYAGPGHWNDPDTLVVGRVGWGYPRPTHLKPNEQILQVSMWCMLAAPVLVSCDLRRLDPFTLALLTNDEALDIDQDPLGKPAGLRKKEGFGEVWSRPLFDGTTAVGLVNRGPDTQTVKADWKAIGVSGRQPVRDLWLHKSVGVHGGSYSVAVPPHGCVLVKVGRQRQGDRGRSYTYTKSGDRGRSYTYTKSAFADSRFGWGAEDRLRVSAVNSGVGLGRRIRGPAD
jgi:alpha-galactosidase